jgi:hypothetical protein
MPRRAQRRDARVSLAAEQRVDDLHRAARGVQRRGPGLADRERVGVDRAAAALAQLPQELQIRRGMHRQELLLGRLRGRAHVAAEPVGGLHRRLQRPDPRRALRVPRDVVGERGVVAQPDGGHAGTVRQP